MIRSLKTFAIGLATIAAMNAGAVAPAQANQFASVGNVTFAVQAEQSTTNKLTIDGSSVTCTTARFATLGEILSPAQTITVHASYAGCSAFGFIGVTIATTGCNYILAVGTKIAEGVKYNGSLELVCEAGKKINISAGGVCEATFSGPQSFSGITYTNESGKVAVAANLTGIKTVKTKDGFGCPFSGTGETTASLQGNSLAAATHSGSPVGIAAEG